MTCANEMYDMCRYKDSDDDITLRWKTKDVSDGGVITIANVDLTGSTAYLTIAGFDRESIMTIVSETADLAEGLMRFPLSKADTQILYGNTFSSVTYYYDVEVVDAGSNSTTILAGEFKIVADLAERI